MPSHSRDSPFQADGSKQKTQAVPRSESKKEGEWTCAFLNRLCGFAAVLFAILGSPFC
jgi:hypothetical protein